MKVYENPALQSEPLWIKQLPVSLSGQARFGERQSHWSYLIEQYTGLNCANDDSLAPLTTLTLLYFSSIPYRVHAIHIQYCWYLQLLDFWTPNFKATVISTFVVHLLWKSTNWLKKVEKMLCAVLWNSCMQFSDYAPPKVVPLFLDHPIYELLFWLRCHQTVTKYVIWGITRTYLVALCLSSTRCETKKNIMQAKQLFDCDS